MTTLLAMWAQEAANGKAEDRYVNTWHFTTTSNPPAPASLTEITTALTAFYNVCRNFQTTSLVTSLATLKFYNLADPKPRIPITTNSITLGAVSGGAPMASEVCVCLSYHAPYVSGVANARRRGRVYIGPLNSTQLDGSGFITTGCVGGLKSAAQDLLNASTAAADWEWAQYSSVSGVAAPVSNGWVDNAPDIQRRRGRAATVRTLWP